MTGTRECALSKSRDFRIDRAGYLRVITITINQPATCISTRLVASKSSLSTQLEKAKVQGTIMDFLKTSPYTLPALLAAGLLLNPYIFPPPETREQIIKPQDEHVLILGGSEGCGKGLAEKYVLKRGAKV
jgi:hypothetical protein